MGAQNNNDYLYITHPMIKFFPHLFYLLGKLLKVNVINLNTKYKIKILII